MLCMAALHRFISEQTIMLSNKGWVTTIRTIARWQESIERSTKRAWNNSKPKEMENI
jgi:hypothetical protein